MLFRSQDEAVAVSFALEQLLDQLNRLVVPAYEVLRLDLSTSLGQLPLEVGVIARELADTGEDHLGFLVALQQLVSVPCEGEACNPLLALYGIEESLEQRRSVDHRENWGGMWDVPGMKNMASPRIAAGQSWIRTGSCH